MRRLALASLMGCLLVLSGCEGEIGGTDEGDGGATGGGETVTGGSGGQGGSTTVTGGSGGETTGTGGSDSPPPCAVDNTPGVCVDVADCPDGSTSIPGYCPGPANIQCCVKSASSTCDPSEHVEPNDGLAEAPGTDGCPDGMLLVDTFCIDRFEASLVTLDGQPWSPYFNPGSTPVRAVSIEGAVPQAYIDGIQAGDACAKAGKRLCYDDEWLRACRGPDQYVYPYGDTLELGVCNDHRAEHPAIEYFGTNADWIWSELGNACIDQLHDSLDRTGQNPGCVTFEGAYDMMGNLHEWTADPAGTFRGGYYVDTKINGPGCLYATTAHNTSHWDYSTGFRCCADAP